MPATPQRGDFVRVRTRRWLVEGERSVRELEDLLGIRQPGLFPTVWRVTELEAGTGFTWITTSPGLRLTATGEAGSRDAGTSRATAPRRADRSEQRL